MKEVTFKLMPYKNGLWCVGREDMEFIDVTTKDSSDQQFIEGFSEKRIVFKGSLEQCESFKKMASGTLNL